MLNYSAAHESRVALLGKERLNYPENHIEADNRLSWLLGRLDEHYGDTAFYVQLQRDPDATALSFSKRDQLEFGIMRAYRDGILMGGQTEYSSHILAHDYLETVAANIRLFLKDKSHKMTFQLENAEADFRKFWALIGAEGNLDEALLEWRVRHNASESDGF